jgi:hypothetical protein
MKLFELAFATYTYNVSNSFNDTYEVFLNKTNNSIDLDNPPHLKALLVWLNSWGCRQFIVECHPIAAQNISDWYKDYSSYLPEKNKNIWELEDKDYNSIADAFDSLKQTIVSIRTKNKPEDVTAGPTGTSKIFFALRPKSLIPCDIPMRKHFGLKDSSEGYINYLKIVKNIIIELEKECRQHGFEISKLPEQIGSPNSTIPILIDEYHWFTISNNIKPGVTKIPSTELLNKWFQWSKVLLKY